MIIRGRKALVLSVGLFLSAPVVAEPVTPEQPAQQQTGAVLLRQVETYAQAVLERNTAQASAMLSRRKLERIQKKYPDQSLSRFADTERANLVGAIGEVDSVRGRFSLLKLENAPEGVLVSVAFDGRELRKPLLFVREDGAYKFDGGHSTLSAEDYLIQNLSLKAQPLACYYQRSRTIELSYMGVYMTCDDIGDICDFTGTRFTYKGVSQHCDYNTWGFDFYINSDDSAECNDRC